MLEKRVKDDLMLHYKVASAFSIDVAAAIYVIKTHYALFVDVGLVHKLVESTMNMEVRSIEATKMEKCKKKQRRTKLSIKSVKILI